LLLLFGWCAAMFRHPLAVRADAFNYLSWQTLPANISDGQPVLRWASSLSLTGAAVTSGTPNLQSVQLVHARIAQQGGVWHKGVKHAVEVEYISDDSSVAGAPCGRRE